MKRSLVAVLVISVALASCGKKNDDCIDPNTFVNKCIEAQLNQEQVEAQKLYIELGPPSTEPTNIWPTETHTQTRVIERRVIVEKEKSSSLLPTVGGIVGGWLGKQYADRKAKQQVQQQPVIVPNVQRPPVRVVPIVPNVKPYVPPPRPTYTPPRPTYTAPKPVYSAPRVTVTPSYRAPTVRGR